MECPSLGVRPVVVEPPLCSRFRTPKSTCTTCVDLCPTEAIRTTEQGVEIAGNCHGCGVCFAGCPNGAFRMARKDDAAVLTQIRARCATGSAGSTVFRIRCARGSASADLIVPCLGRLTEALLLEPLRLGQAATEILEPPCEGCPSARAVSRLDALIRRARLLCELVGRGRDAIRSSEVPLRSGDAAAERAATRRDFFRSMQGHAFGFAAASAGPSSETTEGGGVPGFRELLARHGESAKRSLLLDCLRGFPSRGPGVPGDPSVQSFVGSAMNVAAPDGLSAALEVTRECTACGVCATLCPTAALSARWAGGEFRLTFRPWACTNCQVCVVVCVHRAVRARKTVRMDSLLATEETPLFVARKATCRFCGDTFPANGGELCPLCTHRQRQRPAIHV